MSAQSSQLLIYAELLSNIRQVSVGCSLPSPCQTTTAATVSSDGQSLTLSHAGEDISVQLPGRVAAPPALPIHGRSTTTLSWRLPLAPSQVSPLPSSLEAQAIPWSAGDLEPESAVHCRQCKSQIIPYGVLKVWKDLPSENWAEMMEFWHCHKPHDHDHHDDDGLTSRGYGASSQISAQTGVGFSDLTSFLFLEDDCVENSLSKILPLANTPTKEDEREDSPDGEATGAKGQSQPIQCSSCSAELGILKDETSSVSLFKWQLTIRSPRTGQDLRRQPSLANCTSSMLMATLSRSGCSKSIIVPLNPVFKDSSQPNAKSPHSSLLHIWLFNGNITFSTTKASDDPTPAVKVLYRIMDQKEADKMLDSMTSDVQDIALPSTGIDSILRLLRQSSDYLPPNDRSFKEWTVGLLEKWDGGGD